MKLQTTLVLPSSPDEEGNCYPIHGDTTRLPVTFRHYLCRFLDSGMFVVKGERVPAYGNDEQDDAVTLSLRLRTNKTVDLGSADIQLLLKVGTSNNNGLGTWIKQLYKAILEPEEMEDKHSKPLLEVLKMNIALVMPGQTELSYHDPKKVLEIWLNLEEVEKQKAKKKKQKITSTTNGSGVEAEPER